MVALRPFSLTPLIAESGELAGRRNKIEDRRANNRSNAQIGRRS
jgi:hypothetical protein